MAYHNSSEIVLPAISTLLADETQFVHKPAQVELQLDWSQLSYSEYSGPLPQKAQPNAQYNKKSPTLNNGTTELPYLLTWKKDMKLGREKYIYPLGHDHKLKVHIIYPLTEPED